MLGEGAEEKSKTCTDEERWRKNSAHRSGAECGRGCEHFEQQDESQRLLKPLAAQNLVHHAVTVAANLRVEHGKRADD